MVYEFLLATVILMCELVGNTWPSPFGKYNLSLNISLFIPDEFLD